ncbi:MAG TPA: hypothetical protein VHG52_14435, partial [Thermomicrobiales bacterium]|nr:hypothetical protein [Thermomicrobiales bacterium]
EQDLAYLQEVLLKAAALGQRLPGLQQPIVLPLHCRLRTGSSHPFLTEHLSPALNLNDVPAMLRPMSANEYRAAYPGGADVRYLTFQPPDISPGRIRLVISALRGRPDGDPPPDEVGNLQAEFRLADGRWEAAGMPDLFIRNGSSPKQNE